MKKTKQVLAFELLEEELEVISKEELMTFKGGDGQYGIDPQGNYYYKAEGSDTWVFLGSTLDVTIHGSNGSGNFVSLPIGGGGGSWPSTSSNGGSNTSNGGGGSGGNNGSFTNPNNSSGYNSSGYPSNGSGGYDPSGFNSAGYNSAGYDARGYDVQGFNSMGYNASGFNSSGYNAQGFNAQGYNINGAHNNSGNEMEDFIAMLTKKGLAESIKAIAPKLNSSFEQDLFEKYWYGEIPGSAGIPGTLALSSDEFNELKAVVASQVIDFQNTPLQAELNGQKYYIHGVSTYSSDKYDFGIGSALGIYNQTGELIGIYDNYNFDAANRSWYAEFVTQSINTISPDTARSYYITAGNIPTELIPYLNTIVR